MSVFWCVFGFPPPVLVLLFAAGASAPVLLATLPFFWCVFGCPPIDVWVPTDLNHAGGPSRGAPIGVVAQPEPLWEGEQMGTRDAHLLIARLHREALLVMTHAARRPFQCLAVAANLPPPSPKGCVYTGQTAQVTLPK